MTSPFASRSLGWMTLASLLVFSPQLAGCDTNARSDLAKEAEQAPKPSAPAVKTLPTDDRKKKEDEAVQLAQLPEEPKAGQPKSAAAVTTAPLVKRLVIASDVDKREPIGLTTAKTKEPVVAFVELKNETESDSGVVITFEHEGGQKVGFIELDVPKDSPRYRTWGRTRNISQPGKWTAIVTSRSGEELAKTSFTVEGA